MLKIYHNPRCSKSRQTLKLVTENYDDKIEIVEYLKNTPSKEELVEIIKKLDISPLDLIRKSEPEYKSEIKGNTLSHEILIELMLKFPKLIERPIVVLNNKAIIGRPPENVLTILK